MFVSTYPPRECGIATFTQDLLLNIISEDPGIKANVCAIDPGKDESAYGCLSPLIYPKSRVLHVIKDTDPISFVEAAHRINATRFGITNIQHEYGLYGGAWGSNIIEFMEVLEKPIITTLHTILPNPPSKARAVTREICNLSDSVVVPAQVGADILQDESCTVSPQAEKSGVAKGEHARISQHQVEGHGKKGKDKDFAREGNVRSDMWKNDRQQKSG